MKSLLYRAVMVGQLIAGVVPPAATADRPDEPGAALFNARHALRFNLEIPETNLAKMRAGDTNYVRGTVRAGDVLFLDVGVRLKGRGSFRPVTNRPSLAVKFDEFVPEQKLHGLTKLMLNNASQDATLLSEYLVAGLFRDAGVPAARVTHARVLLNGRDLGFYVVVEAMNKVFLRQHFKDPKGNLYEGYAQDIDQFLDQDNGPISDQSDRRALVAAAQAPATERLPLLQRHLDLDRFISFLAVTMLTAQHDSYPLNRNNYRLYREPGSDRFVMLPHGIDGSFSRNGLSLEPPLNYLLTRAVMEHPETRALYHARVGQVFTNVFDLGRLTNRIQAAVAHWSGAATNEIEREALQVRASSFLRQVARRRENVRKQLSGDLPKPLDFGPANRVSVGGWEATPGTGVWINERRRWENIETLYLKILPETGVAMASWRTYLCLAPGRYRMTARVRVSGLSLGSDPLSRSFGATVRISGASVASRFRQNDTWGGVEHVFTVRETGEIQLVCELRSSKAEAWFDLNSLQLEPLER